ncbi:MAG: hypothetical protein ABSG00_13125, partial [Terracidiphilus sp.]
FINAIGFSPDLRRKDLPVRGRRESPSAASSLRELIRFLSPGVHAIPQKLAQPKRARLTV